MASNTKRFMIYALSILLIFTGVFVVFALLLKENHLHRFDLTIITWVQSFISPDMTSVMKFFTFMGSAAGVIGSGIIAVILMLINKKWWETLFFIIAVSGSRLFNELLKWLFHRARPDVHRLITETGYSFPSGHSMSSIVIYGMIMFFLVLFFTKWWAKAIAILIFSLLILFIGLSRIYLGVHYPSDVIAGFSAGGTWLLACLIFLNFIVEKRANKNQ
ncbi:MAG: phosphatase PAP2 family protein [Tuberibacillus sp.]